jgi:hypothetical protein
MAKIKFKNHSEVDRILPGNTRFETVRCMPHAVVEIDPEHLKCFAPEDVAALKPYEPEPPKALVGKPPAGPDPDVIETDELIAMLQKANNVGPQE